MQVSQLVKLAKNKNLLKSGDMAHLNIYLNVQNNKYLFILYA